MVWSEINGQAKLTAADSSAAQHRNEQHKHFICSSGFTGASLEPGRNQRRLSVGRSTWFTSAAIVFGSALILTTTASVKLLRSDHC